MTAAGRPQPKWRGIWGSGGRAGEDKVGARALGGGRRCGGGEAEAGRGGSSFPSLAASLDAGYKYYQADSMLVTSRQIASKWQSTCRLLHSLAAAA